MLAVQLQYFAAKLGDVFRTGAAVKVEVFQEGALVEAFEDLIGEIVVADGQPMPDDVLDGVDSEISIDALQRFPGPVSSFGCAGKQIAIEQRLDLHVPDQQLERLARGKVFDTKGDNAIDQTPFETPGAAVENEFQGHKDHSQEEVCDRKERADEPVIEPRLFAAK